MEILLTVLVLCAGLASYRYFLVRKAEKKRAWLEAVSYIEKEKAKKCKPVTEHFYSEEEKARRAYADEVWNKRFNKGGPGGYSTSRTKISGSEDDTLTNLFLATTLVNSLTDHATSTDIPAIQNDNFSGGGGEFGGGGSSGSWDTGSSSSYDSGSSNFDSGSGGGFDSGGGSFGGD